MGTFTKETFAAKLKEQGVVLSERQHEQFERYAALLAQWNERMNLTAITAADEVYEKHVYDSVVPFLHTDAVSFCDVGAGAGFPSIPVKILYPHLQVTILEPLAKRIRFLHALCEELSLTQVNLLHVRAEEYARTHRECFDIVSARAVAALPLLSELCLPLVRIGGMFVAMKGPGAKAEMLAAAHAVETLGAHLEKSEESSLGEDAVRINVYYRKDRPTPKRYPRNYGQMKKHPL